MMLLQTNYPTRGWTEAMQLMKEGAKWELYIPSELGYGDRGAGGSIPGGAVLIFTLELLKVRALEIIRNGRRMIVKNALYELVWILFVILTSSHVIDSTG